MVATLSFLTDISIIITHGPPDGNGIFLSCILTMGHIIRQLSPPRFSADRVPLFFSHGQTKNLFMGHKSLSSHHVHAV